LVFTFLEPFPKLAPAGEACRRFFYFFSTLLLLIGAGLWKYSFLVLVLHAGYSDPEKRSIGKTLHDC